MKKSSLGIRIKACELAAEVLAGHAWEDAAPMPLGWSLAVFFEGYMLKGAKGTLKDFGPKRPRKLKSIRGSKAE